ncbi:MAG: SH3 domain-containing protein [Gemmatimonadaceae bacterium]
MRPPHMRHLLTTSVAASLLALAFSGTTIALEAQTGGQPATQSAMPSASQTQAATPVSSYNVAKPTQLRSAPDATALGQLGAGANVEVIARARGWVRVRTEGWVQEADLTPADSAFRANLSAADIRSDPMAARGKMVQWAVEFVALQTADPLRHGLADEEPYILARGPSGENSLLYLFVPPSLTTMARALQPLAKIAVTARVRDGRSEPVGVPILDLQTIRRIQ